MLPANLCDTLKIKRFVAKVGEGFEYRSVGSREVSVVLIRPFLPRRFFIINELIYKYSSSGGRILNEITIIKME
jgi:hypothetical protein